MAEQLGAKTSSTAPAAASGGPERLGPRAATEPTGSPPAGPAAETERESLEARAQALAALEERLRMREAALDDATVRLRSALSSARIGTWDWELRSGRIKWAPEHYRLYGYEPYAIKPTFGFIRRRCVHPDDIVRCEQEFQAGLRERRAYDVEFRVIWPNGEVHWLQSRGNFVFDKAGKPTRMSGVTLDIDRLKQAERAAKEAHEKLSTIAEATPGTIFTFRETRDGQRTFPYATAHLRDTHGIEPEDLARDPSLMFSRVHPEDLPNVVAASDESARTMTMWHSRFRHQHPEKGEVWIEAYSSPLREPDGSITWHGIAHDITDVMRSETELVQAQRRAENADRAKSQFLANMSHEIRTPMSAILGYVDILSSRLTDPDNLQSLETIRSNGRYLLEIIDDILDLSRIEAGKLDIAKERIRPDKLVLEVQSLMKLRAADRGLTLAVEFDGPLPETIETDATRLRQILINLIENAIKFTERGTIRVALRFDAAASRLAIDVADTGSGIPPDTLARLFRPFTQADASLTRRFGGSGLGLSICRALAQLLGGDVAVASRVGEGSVFTVTIAVGDLTGVAVRTAVIADAVSRASEPPMRALSACVLVVDDRAEIRHLAAHMLEQAGARVELAVDGRDALRRVAEARASGLAFDAILLDMQMPVLDGYAAAAELRAQGFAEPIIALTANAMKEDERKCLECGCDAYLPKPLDRTVLIDAIARYTEPQQRAGGAAQSAPPRAAAVRVLVADDNEDFCAMLRLMLELAGYEVAVAFDGNAAFAAASTADFDAILLDMGLPGLSGAEVATRLKARGDQGNTRLIGLSGRGLTEPEWRSLGFDHYLLKPADIAAVTALLDQGRLLPRLAE